MQAVLVLSVNSLSNVNAVLVSISFNGNLYDCLCSCQDITDHWFDNTKVEY